MDGFKSPGVFVRSKQNNNQHASWSRWQSMRGQQLVAVGGRLIELFYGLFHVPLSAIQPPRCSSRYAGAGIRRGGCRFADCRLCVVCARSSKVSIMKIGRCWAAALGRLQCLAGLITEGAEKQKKKTKVLCSFAGGPCHCQNRMDVLHGIGSAGVGTVCRVWVCSDGLWRACKKEMHCLGHLRRA